MRANQVLAVTVAMLLLLSPAAAAGSASVTVHVNADVVVNASSAGRLGLNTDYWWDDQANRPAGTRPLASALADMDVRYARYPGGEEADGYLWSRPPYTAPAPRLARIGAADWPSNDRSYWTLPGDPKGDWAHAIYDFDEFMADCRAVHCQPVLVVAEDGIYKPSSSGGTSLTRADALEAAVAWVHYANVVKGYGVEYWEIGNETWLDTYMGANPGPEAYGRDVAAFSRAMKAVDPTVRIGANGNSRSWFQSVLGEAGPDIDFLAVHSYPSYGLSFGAYQAAVLPTRTETDAAAAALATFPQHAARIAIAVTEFGVLNASNDLGSALINFSVAGDLLDDPRVQFAMMWDTRWGDAGASSSSDAVDPGNRLTPMGRALSIWGQFRHGGMISATSSSASVLTYAARVPASGQVSIFLVNKSSARLSARVDLTGAPMLTPVNRWVLTGRSPSDPRPTFGRRDDVAPVAGRMTLSVEPYSVTVLAGGAR